MKKSKKWGITLIASITYGINVPVLYMFEKNRIAHEYSLNPTLTKKDFIRKIDYSTGRTSKRHDGKYLQEQVYLASNDGNVRITDVDYIIDENQEGKVLEEPWMYDVALDNVLNTLKRDKENLYGKVIEERTDIVFRR